MKYILLVLFSIVQLSCAVDTPLRQTTGIVDDGSGGSTDGGGSDGGDEENFNIKYKFRMTTRSDDAIFYQDPNGDKSDRRFFNVITYERRRGSGGGGNKFTTGPQASKGYNGDFGYTFNNSKNAITPYEEIRSLPTIAYNVKTGSKSESWTIYRVMTGQLGTKEHLVHFTLKIPSGYKKDDVVLITIHTENRSDRGIVRYKLEQNDDDPYKNAVKLKIKVRAKGTSTTGAFKKDFVLTPSLNKELWIGYIRYSLPLDYTSGYYAGEIQEKSYNDGSIRPYHDGQDRHYGYSESTANTLSTEYTDLTTSEMHFDYKVPYTITYYPGYDYNRWGPFSIVVGSYYDALFPNYRLRKEDIELPKDLNVRDGDTLYYTVQLDDTKSTLVYDGTSPK